MKYVLMIFFLFSAFIYSQTTTSNFTLELESAVTGQTVLNADIDLYQSGSKIYDLTEIEAGKYNHPAVATGRYDVYVGGNALPGYSGIWIGGNKLTTIQHRWTDSGVLIVSTAMPDSQLYARHMHSSLLSFISSGGNVTNREDGLWILQNPDSTLTVRVDSVNNRINKVVGNKINGDGVTNKILYSSDYTNISAAISDFLAAKTTFVLNDEITVSGRVTLPADVILQADQQVGKFVGNGGANDTLFLTKTYLDAIPRQIFDNIVVIGSTTSEVIYPEWFGATRNDTSDDTDGIQAANNLAGGANAYGGSNTISLLNGYYYATSCTLKTQTRLIGNGPTSGSTTSQLGGTKILQIAGTNKDLIVADTNEVANHSHWIQIKDLSLIGDKTTSTRGNGIFTRFTGEGFKLENLSISNFASSGIRIQNGQIVPLYMENIHVFQNDSAGVYVYLDAQFLNAQISYINHISGDNNGIALVWLRGGETTANGGNWILDAVKSESSASGRQLDVIRVENWGTGTIEVRGITSSGAASIGGNASIHVLNSGASVKPAPNVKWSNINTTDTDFQFVVRDDITIGGQSTANARKRLRIPTSSSWTNGVHSGGSNFVQMFHRGIGFGKPDTLNQNDTSPFIYQNSFWLTNNTSNTPMWQLDDGFSNADIGRIIYIFVNDDNTSLTHGTYFDLTGIQDGATGSQAIKKYPDNSVITLMKVGASKWREIAEERGQFSSLRVGANAAGSEYATIDSMKVVSDTLRFFVGGTEYKTVK